MSKPKKPTPSQAETPDEEWAHRHYIEGLTGGAEEGEARTFNDPLDPRALAFLDIVQGDEVAEPHYALSEEQVRALQLLRSFPRDLVVSATEVAVLSEDTDGHTFSAESLKKILKSLCDLDPPLARSFPRRGFQAL